LRRSGAEGDRRWLLHRLLADTPLEFFVLFSSASALINSPLVGSYAAANVSRCARGGAVQQGRPRSA
jgi:hypothetical protein